MMQGKFLIQCKGPNALIYRPQPQVQLNTIRRYVISCCHRVHNISLDTLTFPSVLFAGTLFHTMR